ncbi:SIR2 family protein [Thiothrix litoralis]|jgi:hypothetical protein|uniref:SIR2 family protein n=1 Tax=Thiothrix litoralis TaxID=2891210 RepID=A0ABX7WZ46_9GAMM|nr:MULTISPECIES: SIR2 family protein [Thiothrix]QTR47658.1 SIR2 family protein [Thiothrix litoralis]WMP17237.1 SIR2 family protein [Thiothrix lacustris]
MPNTTLQTLLAGVANNTIVPYLGAGALQGSVDKLSGVAIPADSDSLILAMNGGKPMSQRLMWEFPRAAMDVELKRGRKAVHNFLEDTYGKRKWTRAPLHDWLASIEPHYVIDTNRDTQLQDTYADQPHTLIRGTARISGTNYRFVLNEYVGSGGYREITQEEVNPALPILFKPMGSPRPDANYIASDADYVDYITELMGGFAIPDFLKEYRKGKQYLFIGMRLQRDTDRMVMSDITYASAEPKGWALIPQPTDKEVRFCARQGIEIIAADVGDLLAAAGFAAAKAA